jgi:5-hydroxyisourate hydrolase-like protein (transthyretin family)
LPALLAIVLFSLLLFAVPAAAATSAAPTAPGSIRGRVTDEADVGLAGIEVALFRGQDYYPLITVKTNADGAYQLLGLGPGVYTVRFADPASHFQTEYYDDSFIRAAATEVVVAGNQLNGVNATLAVGGRITGTVAVHRGQIELLQLSLYQQQNTDPRLIQMVQLPPAASDYQFPGLMPGSYYLCAYAIVAPADGGYLMENHECYDDVATALPTAAVPIRVRAGQTTPAINFVLDDRPDRGLLTGTVITAVGAPLSNTAVTLYRNDASEWAGPLKSTKTDQRGRFAFYYLDPVPYALTFDDPQAQWLYGGSKIEPIGEHALAIDLSLPHHRQQITTTFMAAAQITGVVTFYGTVPPQRGVVKAYAPHGDDWWERQSATVDATGRYTLTGLYAGTYRLGVEARLVDSGQQTYYGGDTLATATELRLDQGEVRDNINWDLSGGLFDSVITGTVTADGQPVAGIRVELWYGYPEGALFVVYTVTDNAGEYRLAGLPQHVYYMRFADPQGRYAVTYPGDALWMGASPALVTDGTDQIGNIDATLIQGGAIHGTVRRYDGMPVVNALAGAYMTTDQFWWSQVQEEVTFLTNEHGDYTITGLRPGLYRVGFAEADQRYPSQEFYGPAATYRTATDVLVEAGKTTTGVDIILGPDHLVWLPLLAR